MNLSTLTLNERERLAYAEGYTETAKLLAETADFEQERDKLQDRLDEVEFDHGELETKYYDLIDERDELESDFDRVVDERDAAQSGLDEIGCKLHDTRAELAMATDKLKTYRAALMAIESEVPAHIREFIREVLA